MKEKASKNSKNPKITKDKAKEPHFEPVKIEIEDPTNLLLLLKCENFKVQVQALYHLRKFLSAANETVVDSMLKNNLLPTLLPLLTNEDICIKKLSYAILGLVIEFPSVKFALYDPDWMNTLFESFTKWEDPLILENITKIFSAITDDEIGKSFVLSTIPLEKISACLEIDDPDIKKHALKMILNYLEDGSVESDVLKIETLFKLIDSEYPVIQRLTFDVLKNIMGKNNGINAQLKFKQLGGFNKLMTYLEKPEYEDLHPGIIEIFGLISKECDKAEIMDANNLRRLLNLSRKILNVNKLEMLWDTIIELSTSKRNKQILLDYNVMEIITTFLNSSNERLIVVACKAIREFLSDVNQMEKVFDNVPINSITGLMKEEVTGTTKETIISALLQYLKFYTMDEENTTEMDHFSLILDILASSNQEMEVSVELLRGIVTCLTILAQNSFYRERLDPKIYIHHLTRRLLESEDDQLSITILECMSQLVYDDKMCQVLCQGYIEKIWKHFVGSLDKAQLSVAIAQFILVASSAHQSAAISFIRTGTLQWFVVHTQLPQMIHFDSNSELTIWKLVERRKCELIPVWQSVMEKLFECHLSAKFTLNGRLEFSDVIKENFYAWRMKREEGKTYNDLCPLYDDLHQLIFPDIADDSDMIYIVNLQQSSSSSSILRRSCSHSSASLGSKKSLGKKGSEEVKSDNGKSLPKNGSQVVKSDSSKSLPKNGSQVVKSDSGKSLLKNGSKIAFRRDPYLGEYINILTVKLKEEERNSIIEKTSLGVARNVFDTNYQINVLSEFVCDQLSGIDNGVPCTKHYLDLHISDLKAEIKSKMIPLGILRLGMSLERALLFKVLADQIELSCALVRGNHGNCWAEVALNSFETVPTHIVDLMHVPGKLIKLNTPEADKYRSCPKLLAHHLKTQNPNKSIEKIEHRFSDMVQ